MLFEIFGENKFKLRGLKIILFFFILGEFYKISFLGNNLIIEKISFF